MTAWRGGVVGEVADNPSQLVRGLRAPGRRRDPAGVDHHRSLRRIRRASAATRSSRSTGSALAGARHRRTGPGAAGRRRVAGACRPPPARCAASPARSAVSGWSRSTSSSARIAGERAAQLVGRVGDEPLLALGRGLDAVEHRVHRAGQACDLVVGRRLRDAALQVGAAMISATCGADRLDGAQRAADQPPDQRAQHDARRRDGDRKRRAQRGDALLDVVERRRRVNDRRRRLVARQDRIVASVDRQRRPSRCVSSPVRGRAAGWPAKFAVLASTVAVGVDDLGDGILVALAAAASGASPAARRRDRRAVVDCRISSRLSVSSRCVERRAARRAATTEHGERRPRARPR